MSAAPPRVFDVRALLARGEEPFPQIRARVDALHPAESLTVVAPFMPAPLIERLRAEGFASRFERRADGSWAVTFTRPDARSHAKRAAAFACDVQPARPGWTD